MAIISEVKCGRCDRRYPGFRSRCPYCGARRSKHGKYASDNENSRAKLVIGGLLLVVLLVATIVLIVSSLPSKQDPDVANSPSGSPPPSISGDEGLSTMTSEPIISTPPPSTEPPPTGPVAPAIDSVVITYSGEDRDEFTTVLDESVLLSFRTVPASAGDELKVLWETSDENVFMVLQTGEVKPTGTGMATLKLTVGGKTAECTVHVQESW